MAKADRVPGLEAHQPFGEAAATAIARRSRELWRRSENVLDVSDIERVHDMRVATRRLRAVLEIFAGAFPDSQVRPVLREVKALADALGERRDPDVAIEALERFAAGLPATDRIGVESLIARLRLEQAAANDRLAHALDHARRTDLHGRLEALVAGAAP